MLLPGASQHCAKPEARARTALQRGSQQPHAAPIAQPWSSARWGGSTAHPPCCHAAPHSAAHTEASIRPRSTAATAAAVTSAAAKSPPSCHLGWSSGFHSFFSLGQVLGQGSYGTVLEAVSIASGERFAVKVLQKARRAHYRDTIQCEVNNWALAQGSRHVARLVGLFEDEHHAYIVQELCQGCDLKATLETCGYLSEHETAHVMLGVLDMLQECHSHNICYGDVKPANFMLAQPWQPTRGRPACCQTSAPCPSIRAVDFGCSQRLHHGNATRRQSGTPLYSAPEMVFGRHGRPVDVWSAGVMMYQLLTGKLPFWQDKSLEQVAALPAYELLAAVRTFEIHYPRVHWFGLSHEARSLVERMLDRNPTTRITAEAALQHPWFEKALTLPSSSSGDSSSSGSSSSSREEESAVDVGDKAMNNVVGFMPGSGISDGATREQLATHVSSAP